jgi:uncharacterized protein YkwD
MKQAFLLCCLAGLAVTAHLPATPPAQSKAQPKFEMTPPEKEILDLTNETRKKANLGPVRPSLVLFEVARKHSANMARLQQMDHILEGKTPFQRIKAAGYAYLIAGENVGFGNYTVPEVFKGWMDSKAHRDNILDPRYTEIGLGRVLDKDGDYYYTQVFARPRLRR